MKKITTMMTAALMAIAIAAPQSELIAQSRTSSGTTSRTSTSSSSTPTRSSSTSTSTATRSSSTSSSTSTRSTAASSSSQTRTSSSTPTRSTSTSTATRTSSSSTAVSRSTTTTPTRQSSSTSTSSTPTRTSSASTSSTNRTSTSATTTTRSQAAASSSSTTPTRNSSTSSTTTNRTSTTSSTTARSEAVASGTTATRNNMTSTSTASTSSDRRAVTSTSTASSRTETTARPVAGAQAEPVKPVEVKPTANLHQQEHVRPVEHDFISYKHIGHYYDPGNHFFGYRVMRIPSRAFRITYHRHVYYCYNGIYYTPYGSYYRVCRPPFETILELEYARAMDMRRCNFGYYYAEPRVYDAVYRNNNYIDEQYAIIARNNELIAQQNALIAKQNALIEATNSNGRLLATQAYQTAQNNGLYQSYANANADYYYQDGVFYLLTNGQYQVIVPPAGALVEYIPEDYDVITLRDGTPAYKVDETVYKVTVKEGIAYFEVMGQMYE